MSKTNPVKIIIGVDTHKDMHVAVAINGIGAHLGTLTIPVSPKGYQNLETWARAFGSIHAFGIEGTGSYGAGLARFLQAKARMASRNRPAQRRRDRHERDDAPDRQVEDLRLALARTVHGGRLRQPPSRQDAALTNRSCWEMRSPSGASL